MSHCVCPICSRVGRASHLVARRVGSRAKRGATEASVEAVERLADARGCTLAVGWARASIDRGEMRRHSALVAYVHDLVERVEGRSGDEVSLALWRRFAYTRQGAPIQGFELTLPAVRDAQHALLRAIAAR